MMKKILWWILGLLVLLVFFSYLWLRNTAPKYEGQLPLSGLQSEVQVEYDLYGIPHIYAENGEDCYRALGFVHAQDRLFQMEMIRRLASGRLSEILGESMVDADKYFRTLGVRKMAEHTVDSIAPHVTPEMRAHIKAYLAGVNEYVHHGTTPIEFRIIGIPKEDFTEADIYTVLGYMGLGFTLAIKEEPIMDYISRHLGDEYFHDWQYRRSQASADSILAGQGDLSLWVEETSQFMDEAALPIWEGSNGWVISAERSASGKVLFANDTHIGISQPSVWYEAHLNYPGFEFYGNYLAGVPFGVVGHNRDMAYGLTIFPADMVDMYRERSNPSNMDQVWEDDHWADLNISMDTIRIKGADPVVISRRVSRHGPIINDVSKSISEAYKEPVSLWWNYLERPTQALLALYELNHCHNIDQARAAVSKIDFIALNVLYGDRHGDIAHWGAGRIPKRPDHVNPKVILDGASGRDEIERFYDFSENPSNENPPEGFVASANNDPGIVKGRYIPGYYCPDNRINRIEKYFEDQDIWSQSQMKKIQLDEVSDDHRRIASEIALVIEGTKSLTDMERTIHGVLKNWDGDYTLDGVAPTIYTKLVYHTMRLAMADELGEERYHALQPSYLFKGSVQHIVENSNSIWWDDLSTTDIKESRSDICNRAFKITIEELIAQLGNDVSMWKWRRVHTIEHVHPIGRRKPFDQFFNVGPYPITAGNDVPNKMMYTVDSTGLYKTTSSPAMRIVLDFADVESSESINPTGQSGNPMSKHYADQAEMFINGKYRKQMMNREEIKEVSRTLTLTAK